MEIVQRHLQDALRHRYTGRFLHGMRVVLEEEPRQRKRGARGDDAPGYGFGQVADAGFFDVRHGLIARRVLDVGARLQPGNSVLRFHAPLR